MKSIPPELEYLYKDNKNGLSENNTGAVIKFLYSKINELQEEIDTLKNINRVRNGLI